MVRRISSSRPMTGSSLPTQCARGQIDGVLLERTALLLGLRIIDRLAAADLLDGLFDGGLRGAGILH
jgi:hypothetical protein